MALHGTIQVNDTVIGTWWAMRCRRLDLTRADINDEVSDYVCQVHMDAARGSRLGTLWRGTVTHRYGDGALVLAAKILAKAVAETGEGGDS